MSPPKNNNSVPPKNKKLDDSAAPKQAKDGPSAPQPNESNTIENYAATSTSVNRQSVIVDSNEQLMGLNDIIRNHQEFLVDKFIADAKKDRDNDTSVMSQKVMQIAISKVQAEITKGVKVLSILPSVRNDLAKIVAEVEEKIEICDTFVDDLNKDYKTMTGYINQKMKNIGHVHTDIKEIIEMTIDHQKFFDQESQLEAQKIDRINREINFVCKERKDASLQISKSNKVISQMTKDHAKLQETNKRLKEQIDKKKREKNVSDEAFAVMNNNFEHCIHEKKDTIKKLDEEEIELKKVQANLLAGLDKAKDKYKKLCQEEVELTAKTSHQEKLIARVKTANKNLRDGETANNAEFGQKYSQLSVQLKKITDENAEIQGSMDKQQQKWDELKRLQEEILKKQQIHNELQLKSFLLKKENDRFMEEILNTRKNINELKFRNDSEANSAISYTKRIRLFSSTTDEIGLDELELISNSSSINFKDLDVSINYNDFDSIISFNSNME